MEREISAGGLVVRRNAKGWLLAVVEPQLGPAKTGRGGKKLSQKVLLALPKGLLEPGEKAEAAAVREVEEETGLKASCECKLGDIKYVYTRSWGDGARVFKIVSFYLLRYRSGRIDNLEESMRIEVKRARWIPLDQAVTALAYTGERQMAREAQKYLAESGVRRGAGMSR